MSNRGYITYRCRLCGEVIYGETSVRCQRAAELCSAVVLNQQFIGNPYLHQAPMYVVHNCLDGNCGLAEFSGVTYKTNF